jgi:hypothetical protein
LVLVAQVVLVIQAQVQMGLTQALLALQQLHLLAVGVVHHILVLAVMVAMAVVVEAQLDIRLAVMETLVLELLDKVLMVEQVHPLRLLVVLVVEAQVLLVELVEFGVVDMAV